MRARWLAVIVFWIVQRLVRRGPDYLIGGERDPYMRRWWVIPRNRFFNVYLHHVRRDDDDRALHDHPWWSLSLLLHGELGEWYCARPGAPQVWRVLKRGALVFRGARFAHRLALMFPERSGAWTLFITGPVIREWGFHCPQGWRHWKEFTAYHGNGKTGEIGPGCD